MESSIQPNRGTAGTRRRLWRLVIILPFFLLIVGMWADLWSGLPVIRHAKSVLAWVAGTLGLGALYVMGEMGGEWINNRDRVTDPLWRRVLHLLALLLFGAAVCGGMIVVFRSAT
jgi:hypothetical protein